MNHERVPSDPGNDKTLLVTRDGAVAKVTFNRPEKMNPLDWGTVREITTTVREIERDDSIEIIVFTGSGKAFSAGGDLDKYIRLYRSSADFQAFLRDFYAMCDAVERSDRIVIAAVNGFCVAGGLEFMLACDMVVVAEEARIADGHLNFGQLPGGGGSQRLPRAIGALRAKELIFSGRFLSGREAVSIGLATACAPLGDLPRVVKELTDSLLQKSYAGRRGAKYLVNQGLKGPLDSGLELEIAYVHGYATSHPDATEGLMAFKEKRSPRFLPLAAKRK